MVQAFTGVHNINMDAKGRLAFPARQRERLGADCNGQLVATVNVSSPCLFIYPQPAWEQVLEKVQQLPTMRPGVQNFQRLFVGYASELEFDGSGRLLLPSSLREYAGLDKKVVLVGQINKFELWDEARWQDVRQQPVEIPEELQSIAL